MCYSFLPAWLDKSKIWGKTTKVWILFRQVLLHTFKLFSRQIKFGYTATSCMIIVFSLVVPTINFGTGKIPRCQRGKELACQFRRCKRRKHVWSLGQEEPLEKEMAMHSIILARKIPWTEPSTLQSMGS